MHVWTKRRLHRLNRDRHFYIIIATHQLEEAHAASSSMHIANKYYSYIDFISGLSTIVNFFKI